ncbi:MAG: gliding motility-associated C-terminal domain-containing protein [Bacteroidetes bacterium]|nr:gliding motility-associated C-terminal domain-containing protein [Bacteroidota bacterium]
MKRLIYILLFSLNTITGFATHNRAGEITYNWLGGLTYEIVITTYTKESSPADRCELVIHYGDGDTAVLNRTNGPVNSTSACGSIPNGQSLGNDIKKNIYKGTHTYPGSGIYSLWMEDPNRISGVDNIPNSVDVPFALESKLIINSILGSNSSPQLLNPPIDNACTNVCFYHNPGAFDADGDSLSYSLVTCLGASANPIGGYTLPPTTSTLFIDAVTGDFEWCTPLNQGIYNVAILIEEWRTINGQRFRVGQVLRDLQIDVAGCNNDPPVISNLRDTCVNAGTLLTMTVSAFDINGNSISYSASGGPFILSPAATFNSSTRVFSWPTSCNHVRKQPHLVSFKAVDNGNPSLVDFETVKITVVAPAPQNPTANALGTSIKLSWDKSFCDPTNNKFVGYKIYRKAGTSGWSPAHCETGVPSYTGFSLVGSMPISQGFTIDSTNFTDSNNGMGLIHGENYCYRIVACFLDGAESYASIEVCEQLKNDIPIITNVDVTATDIATGGIKVKWTMPITNTQNFDTLVYPGPYRIELKQSEGFVLGTPSIVATFTANSILNWNDTVFTATNLNTKEKAYSYVIDLYALGGTTYVGSSHVASSVFLSITPADKELAFTWSANVPWTNNNYFIYYETSPGTFTLIDSSLAQQYLKQNLLNGKQYCYYILAKGEYSDTTIVRPLYNRSQVVCATPIDLTPPCPPRIVATPDCDLSQVGLVWNNPNNSCANDVVGYRLYYTPVQGDSYSLLATFSSPHDTTYTYANGLSIAGCYLVTAVDSFANESVNAQSFCVDNCPIYELPNVFTPNGDGVNDFYSSLKPYKYVQDVEMKIYNRWGLLVYETTDPDINWNGKNLETKTMCSDGTYYYTCVVNEIRVTGIKPRYLKGFIQLIHGKDGAPTN